MSNLPSGGDVRDIIAAAFIKGRMHGEPFVTSNFRDAQIDQSGVFNPPWISTDFGIERYGLGFRLRLGEFLVENLVEQGVQV